MRTTKKANALYSLIVAFAIVCCGFFFAGSCYADDSADPTALSVYQDNDLKKSFTRKGLEDLGPVTYTYSAFNSYPTPQIASNVKGVTLTSVLQAAGIDPDSIENDQIIEAVAADGIKESFLKKQLLSERYYFPKVQYEAGRQGKEPLASSWDGKTEVPAMISLEEPNGSADQEGRLLFGQRSPTEQNYSAFLKYMLSGGKIIVRTTEGSQWKSIQKTDPAVGTLMKLGREISFDRAVNDAPNIFTERYCIYYTTDGSEPNEGSALYNYNNFNFGSPYEKFNRPVISKEGNVTIKTKVMGYGAKDSTVSTFTFRGYRVPAKTKIKKITAKKKALTLKWTKVNDAMGYKIYRATKKNGKYSLVKTIGKNSKLTWTNKKLKKKKTYFYKIRAYKYVNGTIIYSDYSAVKNKKTR